MVACVFGDAVGRRRVRNCIGNDAIGWQAVKQTFYVGDDFFLDGAKGIVEQGGISLLVDEWRRPARYRIG